MSTKNYKRIYIIVLALIPLVILFFGGKIVRDRAFSYGYQPQQDYRYVFNPGYAEILELQLDGNRLNLSDLSDGYNTAILEMDICFTFKGFANQPEVATIAGADTLFQNLECRTKGIRYLNVSQLVQKGASEIHFQFLGCKLQSDSVKLIAYRNFDPTVEQILILSPHPDDAEIAAYGLYASNPQNTFIATITAGDAGSMRYDELYTDSTTHYIKKGEVRVWNSITVPMLAGVAPENAINLGYFDALLKKMHDDTTSLAKSRYLNTTDISIFRSANCTHLPDSIIPMSNWRSLVNDLKYLLLKVRPTIVLSTYPAIDYHFDHKLTTVALQQAMVELDFHQCEIWLYTNHFPLTKIYPDGKIGSQVSLPPHLESEPIYFDKLFSFPLSKNLQSDKVMALDAMNDLRPDTQYRDTKVLWQQTKQNFYDKLYLKESDYFRRSVRSNELFFVIEGNHFTDQTIFNNILGNID